MSRFANDLFLAAAFESDRLRLLQWALYGLVRQLDEEGTYRSGWIGHSTGKIGERTPQEIVTKYEEQLRTHLAALDAVGPLALMVEVTLLSAPALKLSIRRNHQFMQDVDGAVAAAVRTTCSMDTTPPTDHRGPISAGLPDPLGLIT
jgi:hypothetical protein